jgi:hypothetical protein
MVTLPPILGTIIVSFHAGTVVYKEAYRDRRRNGEDLRWIHMLMEWMIHATLIDDLPYFVSPCLRSDRIGIHTQILTVNQAPSHPHAKTIFPRQGLRLRLPFRVRIN